MRKKIGSGITDSNGVASCNYTGKAVGKMNVVAETKTDDRILQSEPYEVCDAIFYDTCTTGTVPNMVKKSVNSAIMSSDENGLYCENIVTTGTIYVGLDKEQSSQSITNWIDWCDVAFEFEYVSHTGNVGFQLRPQSSSIIEYSLNNCSNGDIIRVEYSNGIVNVFKNNTQVVTGNMNVGELTAIRFSVTPSDTLTIKNLKLWSI